MPLKMCSRCHKNPAVVYITRIEGDKSYPEGLCLQCAKSLGIQPINDMLNQMNIPEEDLNAMSEQLSELYGEMADENTDLSTISDDESEDGDFEPGGAATSAFPFLQNLFGGARQNRDDSAAVEDKTKSNVNGKDKAKKKKRKFLETYCTNLTQKAKDGSIDRIIGREREMYRVVQILSRRIKNNPCLIGEPGVGKTAIAEGLALKIANGDVPAKLMDKEIHLLDLTALVAGTQFRGQFESRIKSLIQEVKADGNVILFIDEVHNLVGSGDSEGSMNAANILKPALSRGEIQVIGATTFTEYRKYIEKDTALERRFQPVTVEEPSVKDTIELLKGIKSYYENFHEVKVPDNIINRAVILSERYINDRYLPDKAIDLLDEACAAKRLKNKQADELYALGRDIKELEHREEELEAETENVDYEQLAEVKSELAKKRMQSGEIKIPESAYEVDEDDLAHVIELWTGIPASKVKESDLKKLNSLDDEMKKHIIGQNEAVEAVCAAVRRSRVQISPRRRPASFIFVGPTDVGKTVLVKILAGELFDSPETLIRLDMSEFMEKHSVSRIIGSPPGYVGYDEAGQLTEKVRRKPYSVLLFDEIEKAHPDVLNILLQILDDGRITDAHGRTVNFENTIIVMTSNAGSDKKDSVLGFNKTEAEASKEKAIKALEAFLRPEFMSRVDEVIVFRPLSREDFSKIAVLMLNELKGPMSEKGITLKWTPAVPEMLSEKSYGGKRGARDLRSCIRREAEDKIAGLLVEECDKTFNEINLSVKGGNIFVCGK